MSGEDSFESEADFNRRNLYHMNSVTLRLNYPFSVHVYLRVYVLQEIVGLDGLY